jgi:4-hydroxy-tetrahydrodipicolinate synthase
MPRPRFVGAYVPIITPFDEKGSVNEDALAALIEMMIQQGATGIVPCGTTGESATLTHEEHKRVVELSVKLTAGRVPVIAGTGSNSTAEAIELTQHAEQAGADAALLICPYYNRPGQAGLIAHFKKIASSTTLPLILYNIPKRTGVNMETATTIELSKVENIVGIKEASGDLDQIMAIIAGTEEFSVLTGDDSLCFTLTCLGGTGGILAAGHILPGEWARMIALIQKGNIAEAREIHYRLLPLVKALFSETNPVPIKAAMEMLGIPAGPPRLPLLPASQRCRDVVRAELQRLGLVE